jgi:hypothetical protein
MKLSPLLLVVSLGVGAISLGCKNDPTGGTTGTGGSATGGATGTGGNATGGANGTGGNATGGANGTGGSATGGSIGTGGNATGGATGTGGNATGGVIGTGGHATGGTAGLAGGGTGGSSVGGHAGGSGGGGGTAAGAGGAAGGTTSGCAYKLCENFESGSVGALPTGWTAYNGYGNDAMKGVGLASDQAHSGTMSLKSSSMIAGEERIQKSLTALGATANKHWGRIFFKVQTPAPKTPSGVYFHTTMVALEGTTTENRVVDSVQSPDGTHQWIYNVPDDSCCAGSTYDWTFDASWHCAEWYVDVSLQSYRFFTDSTEVTSLAFTNNANAKMSNYSAIVVGSIFYQTPPSPFVLWLDDLAIDDAQIGCH